LARNIEIKARVRDVARLSEAAARLSDAPVEVLQQEDTFFAVPHGRLKLRIFAGGTGELIFYRREDRHGPKSSDYFISKVSDPQLLCAVLSRALGVRGIVRKKRRLFLIGQTRVHLDEVEGLGSFVELEVVLRDNQPNQEGEKTAQNLMQQLGIQDGDLLSGAYIDMMKT
jgi:predicted adenylyl cyclase CyaB